VSVQAELSGPTVSRATQREWIGLAVIALPCLLYSMDLTVLNLAVPALSADLKPTATQLLWIVDVYGFLVAGALMTMGTLGDRIGRRKLLLIGAVCFGVASVLAAFAPSAELLIAARALLGLAGATLAPSTLSLIRNMFHDPRQRATAIGIWVASFSAGGALGPLVGGILIEHFWWGSVFLIAVPVMVLLLAVGPFLLPEYRDPAAGRLDILSALLSLAAVLSLVYAMKRAAVEGFDELAMLAAAAGLLVGALFLRRQRRLADPMIDLALFRVPGFSAALAINVIGLFAAFGTWLYLAQHLQLMLGLTPLMAGVLTLPSGLAFVAGSLVGPALLRRFGPLAVIVGGFLFAALGYALLILGAAPDGELVLIAGFVVFSLGLAPIMTVTTDIVVGSAPPERTGMASGLSETSAEMGGAVGIAVLGSIGAAIYRASMSKNAPPDLPTEAVERARDTLGGALDVARSLPSPQAEDLVALARDAFAASYQATLAVALVLSLIAAVMAARVLRGIRTAGQAH
jgi:DHA2 family multidrug resistance protein-like MFS transporter